MPIIVQMEDIFVKANLCDKVKIRSGLLRKNKESVLHGILAARYEGKCSYHGYIKQGSISIIKCSAGIIKDVCLNGDVEYTIMYSALVCNPVIGSVVRAKVVNQNMFGILAEVSVMGNVVLEVIVAKMIEAGDQMSVDNIKNGDMINVEILKKKFQLDSVKIVNVGKIVKGDISSRGGGFIDEEDVEEEDELVQDEDDLLKDDEEDDDEDEDKDKDDKDEDDDDDDDDEDEEKDHEDDDEENEDDEEDEDEAWVDAGLDDDDDDDGDGESIGGAASEIE